MTTVEQIAAETEQFKATVVAAVDNFARLGHVTQGQANDFLATVGIDRPESPEVRQAREALDALKASVRAAVANTVSDDYSRRTALSAMGL